MELIVITTCVNYSDILKHNIHQNSKFFKIWYIVTYHKDINTIKLIENFNLSNIKILFYNDFYNNSKFDFGGSRKFAQEFIYENYKGSNILFLDADIYLPDNFLEKLPLTLENNTIYGVNKRLDYWTIDDFKNNTNPHLHKFSKHFIGFFQLYKQCKYKYNNSFNCSKCDEYFRNNFINKINLDLSVKHLGRDGVNWDGRDLKYGTF